MSNNEFKDLQEKVTKEFKNAWTLIDENEKAKVFGFGDDYKVFLDTGKTEEECVDYIIEKAKGAGYVDIMDVIATNELKPGTKIYGDNKGKAAFVMIVGEEPIEKGVNLVGSHIDAPRIDIKPVPLYEDSDVSMLKTHYYGGIKKYQWVSMPLALHGTIYKANGEKVKIAIGEKDDEPIFTITDLLPHLAKDQSQKKLAEGITGEGLNIIVGSIPVGDKDIKNKVKFHILKILSEKYGIVEEDFVTAEIQAVPSFKARDLGFDRGMIAGYGHDDRVCSFAGLRAVLDIEGTPKKTVIAYFADKEEVGSQGNTGMQSHYFENMLDELVTLQNGNYNGLLVKRALANTKVLSADVAAGFDPNFPEVHDKINAPYMGKGVTIVKYTGSRGKSGCNDANASFVREVVNVFNSSDVVWQTGELGKVDQGGGGTIAYILANYGAEVIDCGVPVLSMHAPYEVISTIDLYMAYKGYKAFLLDA